MHLRRLIAVLSVVVVASGVVAAQPAKKKAAPKDKTPATGSAAGSAAGSAEGSAVQPIEDTPPSDMEGREENPDAPRIDDDAPAPVAPPPKRTDYPIEEALRPITLHANMVEVSLDPHAQLSPYTGAAALRARYGITSQIQIGLVYVVGGIWDRQDVDTGLSKKYGFHVGKAVGIEAVYLVQPWLGVKFGLPFYIDPFAMSVALGAPMKFKLNDKVAIGGMDDVLNIALPLGAEFAPSYYQELYNAKAAFGDTRGDTQSRGTLRFSGYGIYNHQPNLAIIGRLAVEMDDFSSSRNAAGHGGLTTSIRAGVQFSPQPKLDIGGSLGWDDLSTLGSFGPQLFAAVRI